MRGRGQFWTGGAQVPGAHPGTSPWASIYWLNTKPPMTQSQGRQKGEVISLVLKHPLFNLEYF